MPPRSFIALAAILAAATTFLPAAAQEQIAKNVSVERDLEFSRPGDKPLLLDLYRPSEPAGPLPVVMWIHGGGWKQGSKDRTPAAWLAENGYAVVSINYRLTDVATWPAQIEDCRAAVRWIRTHAAEFGLDAERIGVWGGSAGGHLAALLGTLDPPAEEAVSSRVRAVCDWYGPSDLLTAPANVPGPNRGEQELAESNGAKLLGGIVRDLPDLAKQASPLHQVSKGDAPFLIMHGDADKTVPLDQSRRLHEALREAGVESTLEVLHGKRHSTKEFHTADDRKLTLQLFNRPLRAAE